MPATAAAPNAPSRSPRRALPPLTWQARLALLALGCVLVLAVEGLCRLAGFGGAPALWATLIRDDTTGQSLVQTNPAALARFFAAPTRSGRVVQGEMRIERLFLPKPPGTIRIVVAGESSVQGFPFPRHLSFPSFLEFHLRQRYPDRTIEVLNVGMTAAASFVVREIVEETLAALDPDLLVIYTGHNEFFGAFGVASLQSVGRSVASMRALSFARTLGIYQALDALARGATRRAAAAAGSGAEGETVRLIEEMAADTNVRPAGPLHRAARRAFETNLRAMVRAARRHDVPLLLATIVANEAGVAPIGHYAEDRAAAERVARDARSIALDPDLDPTARLDRLDALAAKQPLHGLIPYLRGQVLTGLGRRDEALAAFRRAVDLDAQPWRAPSWVNAVIRETAAAEGVPLADVEHAFREASGGGAIGFRLVVDHVHPNLEGQDLVARRLAEAVVATNVAASPAHPPADAPFDAPFDAVAARLGANRLEQLHVATIVTNLFESAPLAAHNAGVAAELHALRRDHVVPLLDAIERDAVARWNQHVPARTGPSSRPSISSFAGVAAVEAGDLARASGYFRAAQAAHPRLSLERLEAGMAALLCARLAAAAAVAREGSDPAAGPAAGSAEGLLAEARYAGALILPPLRPRWETIVGGLHLAAGRAADASRHLDAARRAGHVPPPWIDDLLDRAAGTLDL